MTSKDWFGVVVRVFGLWLVVQAISTVATGMMSLLITGGFGDTFSFPMPPGKATGVTIGVIIPLVVKLVMGLLMLLKADLFVDLAYGPRVDRHLSGDPEDED